jgi:hypothetical protein
MGVREAEPLVRLPQAEQEAWRRLWAEVARTMGRDQAAPWTPIEHEQQKQSVGLAAR